MMTAKCSRLRHRAFGIVTIFVSILFAASCLVLPGGVAVAQKSDAPEKEFEDFDGNNFDRSTTIDNPWFPLKVGMRWVHRGSTSERGKRVAHRLVTVVTDLTKVIDGVRTVVLWVEDYKEGKLDEAELAFFAQDKDGNVWGFGEYPEEYFNGRMIRAPAWIHGLDEARAGIMMMPVPRLDTPSYAQRWAPSDLRTDRGKVDRTDQTT